MKGDILIFAPLCLLLSWMLPVDSKTATFIISLPKANPGIRMSMVADAVDDMYFGCHDKMKKMVMDKYFKSESKAEFGEAWKAAEACRNNHKDKKDKALTKDHLQAICVYTSDEPELYQKFNHAVRTNRTDYGTSFSFHSLHFWLTSALQILNNNRKCHITYRRTNMVFTGDVNQIIRFGFFASSSYKPNLTEFGTTTCFIIKTCSGAYLKKYSHFKDEEQEVLIPPYEKFRITKKMENNFVAGLKDCKYVFSLESAGVDSNLNCKAAEQEVLIPPYETFKITKKMENNFEPGLEDCDVVFSLESAGVVSNLNCKAAGL
ncbi:erythroblast NAD(P)(+)--arginine ADP-ribosyltransferase-like [Centropristis striata]|uniref:erythroblast NAD(P)(+)--arginine ADP-ribosyltransferase-like n=1 Tax=Centropristis striata TaxID=184440 RepID=UPI0027E10CE1|nr:erythroblast NAD(P)(+)--arginine ADP-ribosyltransferase-like [Centropristis striata]